MTNFQGMKDFKMSLVANVPQSRTVAGAGSSYHIIKSTSPLTISFDDGDTMERSQGMGGVTPSVYSKCTVVSEVNQDITIALGNGGVFDSRANISGITLNTTISPANIIDSLPSVTVGAGQTVKVATANSTRKEFRIGVSSDNIDGIYYGNSSTSATTQGAWIDLGGTEFITSESDIYVYNPHDTETITVNLLDLRRV